RLMSLVRYWTFFAAYGWNCATSSRASSFAAIAVLNALGPVTVMYMIGAGAPTFVPVRPRTGFVEMPLRIAAAGRPDFLAASLTAYSLVTNAVASPSCVGGLEICAEPVGESGVPR